MDYQNIITIEAGKRGGKPCTRGIKQLQSNYFAQKKVTINYQPSTNLKP